MITPLPLGEGKGEGPSSFWNLVFSVLLCFSVRNRTHPRYEITHKQLAGEVFLSQSAQSSRSFWRTVWAHRTPSAYREHRGLSTKIGCNVLWTLYAGGVLWVRNVGWNVLLRLWVLWEKKLPRVLFVCYLIRVGAFYFSQSTQKNRIHSIPQRH